MCSGGIFLGYPSVSACVRVSNSSGRAPCYRYNSRTGWRILTKSYTNILYHVQMNWLVFEGWGIKVRVATRSNIWLSYCSGRRHPLSSSYKYFIFLLPSGQQESRAVASKPRDAAAVVFFVLKFADNIHYRFKNSQASSLRKPCFKAPNMPAQNRTYRKMAILGHVFWSQWKGDKGLSNRPTKY